MFGQRWVALGLALVLSAGVQADPPERDRRRSPVVAVVEACRDAVVNISTTKPIQVRYQDPMFDDFFGVPRSRIAQRNVTSVGSGAVIHESGYIVTNAHVVAQSSDIRVTFADGSTLSAKPVTVDADSDLAVIKVQPAHPLTALKLGRSSDIMVGETVVAIGNPLGLQHTVTAGIVSALNRDLEVRESVAYRGLIQSDAAINPGNSGGPLINVNNEMIGINTAVRGDAQNVGFSIPVDRLWEFMPGLLDEEAKERVRFGLKVAGPNAEVLDVEAESPALKAGIRRGDRVLRVDGTTLRDGIDFYARMSSEKPGSQVKLGILREKREFEAIVPLEIRPLPDGAALATSLLGLEFEEFSPAARQRLDFDGAGLLVSSVERNSPAARANIRPGNVILRVNNKPVGTALDVGLALERVTPREPVRVVVLFPDVWQARELSIPTRRRG